MDDQLNWPAWLQAVFVAGMVFLAALAWFTTGWGGLLVIGTGVLFAFYFRFKNSR